MVHWVNVSESSGTGSASACEEFEDNEGGILVNVSDSPGAGSARLSRI